MKLLRSTKMKIAFLELTTIFLYIGIDLLQQVYGIAGYSDSADEVAMGNRIYRLMEAALQGNRMYLWYALVIVVSLLLAYACVKLIASFEIDKSVWFLVMLHVLLYGIVLAGTDKFPTKYTNYGFDGVNLSTWNRFLLIALEIISIPICCRLQDGKKWIEGYLKGKRLIALVLLLLYAAFACVGNALFMKDPVKAWTITFDSLVLFFLFAAWLSPYILGILYWLEKNRGTKVGKPADRDPQGKKRLLLWGTIISGGILLLYYIACNPGNMYVDAIDALEEIYHLPIREMTFAFPIAIKIFYKAILTIIPFPQVITVIQIILAILVEQKVVFLFYRLGVSVKNLLIALAVFNICPMNGIFIVTFMSNYYYAIACVLLFLFLVDEYEKGPDFWTKPINYLRLLLLLILMCATRNEGIVVAALVFMTLLIHICLLYRKMIIPVVLTAVIVSGGLIFSGLFSWLLNKSLSAYATVNADTVNAVVYYKGDYPETTFFPEIVEKEYSTYEVGPLTSYSFNNNVSEIVAYVILHNPEIYLRNRLNKSDCVWDVLENEGIHTAREIIGIYENDMGVVRQNNLLTIALIYLLYPFTIAFCATDVLCYRSGIYLILSFIVALYWNKNRLKRNLLFLPAWGHAFVLFLCLLWQCSRHTYSIILCVFLAGIYSIAKDMQSE